MPARLPCEPTARTVGASATGMLTPTAYSPSLDAHCWVRRMLQRWLPLGVIHWYTCSCVVLPGFAVSSVSSRATHLGAHQRWLVRAVPICCWASLAVAAPATLSFVQAVP